MRTKKLNRNSIISKLYKEFSALEKGHTFHVEMKIKPVRVPVHVCWESDETASYNIDEKSLDFDKSVKDSWWWDIDHVCETSQELADFNKKIKTFISKCDEFALSLGEDKTQFFESMMDRGLDQRNKAERKKALKKQIHLAEQQLNQLKRNLKDVY